MYNIFRGLGLVGMAVVMLSAGTAVAADNKTSGASGHKDRITWPCPDDRTA